MSWFTKKSSTHFVRDEQGQVIDRVESDNSKGHASHPYFDRVAKARHENREYRQREKQEERKAFREARHAERIKLKQEQGRRAASHPVTHMLPPRKVVHVHVTQKPQHHKPHYQEPHQQHHEPQHHQITPAEFQKKILQGFK